MIAPGLDGTASGQLYLDEGDAIEQPKTSLIKYEYANGTVNWGGRFGYDPLVYVAKVTLLGGIPTSKTSLGKRCIVATRNVGWSLTEAGSISF